jgi:hypothetical protein
MTDLFEAPAKQTDKVKILNYLQSGNCLTFNDAQRLFGTNSIRERIRDLRQEGVTIITQKVQNPETKRFHAVYKIIC